MDLQYQLGDDVRQVKLERSGENVRITIADRVYEVTVISSRVGEWTFSVAGIMYTAFVASEGTTRYVTVAGEVFELKRPDTRRARRKQRHGEDNLIASMPGQIAKVLITEGEVVQRGQPLIILEAMKMEIKIAAPHAGRITKVSVAPGQVVDRGQALIEMINEQ